MTVVKPKGWQCSGCSSSEDVADQRPIQFQDEGVNLGGAGTVRIINFVGAAVEAVRSDDTITITITGGSGEETSVDVPIASASILTGNATPVALVPNLNPASYLIPISISLVMDYNSTPYAANTDITIRYSNGTAIYTDSVTGFLASTGNRVIELPMGIVDAVLGEDLQFYIETGNPTGGNSNITVKVKYKSIII